MSLTTPTQSVGLLPQPSTMSPATGVSPLKPVNPVFPASPVTPTGLMSTPPTGMGVSPLTSMPMASSYLAGPVRPVLSNSLGVGGTGSMPVGPGPVGGPLLGAPPPTMMPARNPAGLPLQPAPGPPPPMMMSSVPPPLPHPPLLASQPSLLPQPHTSRVMLVQQPQSTPYYVPPQPMIQQTTPLIQQPQMMTSLLPVPAPRPPPTVVQVPVPTAQPMIQPTLAIQPNVGTIIPVAQPTNPVLLSTPMMQNATPAIVQGAPQQSYVVVQRPIM